MMTQPPMNSAYSSAVTPFWPAVTQRVLPQNRGFGGKIAFLPLEGVRKCLE
jgi:hypothetical protein